MMALQYLVPIHDDPTVAIILARSRRSSTELVRTSKHSLGMELNTMQVSTAQPSTANACPTYSMLTALDSTRGSCCSAASPSSRQMLGGLSASPCCSSFNYKQELHRSFLSVGSEGTGGYVSPLEPLTSQ
jgi:hypothetical protein